MRALGAIKFERDSVVGHHLAVGGVVDDRGTCRASGELETDLLVLTAAAVHGSRVKKERGDDAGSGHGAQPRLVGTVVVKLFRLHLRAGRLALGGPAREDQLHGGAIQANVFLGPRAPLMRAIAPTVGDHPTVWRQARKRLHERLGVAA